MSIRSNWNSIAFVFYGVSFFPLSGQVIQERHFEVAISSFESDAYSIVSAGTSGLALYRTARADKEIGVDIIRLDTALRQLWRGFIPLSKNIHLHQATVANGSIFLLLQNAFNVSSKFQVLSVSLDRGEFQIYDINNIIPFTPKDFLVTHAAALIGGYFNYRPFVMHFDFATRKSRILPGFYNEPGELIQMKALGDGSIDVIVAAQNQEGRRALWIRNYDAEGVLNKTIILEPEAGKNLIFGQSVAVSGEEQVVAGVYGRNREFSRGIFVSRINPFGEYRTSYYNFADLQNFFNYMKAKREKRVKERIQRRKVKGKKIKFNYRFLLHALFPYQDKYILVGEAFYPHYRYPQGFYYGTSTTPQIFDGYRYTHAVVIGIANNGQLLWDNSFEISDIQSFELKQFIKIYPGESSITLLYLFDNIIRAKVIRDNEVLEGTSRRDAKAKNESDPGIELRQLEYWYGGHFYTSGVRHERETGSLSGAKKSFFVDKVSYR